MTFLNRRTFNVRAGKMDEILELLETEGKKIDFPGPVRIYVNHTGTFGTVILDYEFASLAEYETFWTDWFASDHWASIVPRWEALTGPGGTNELLEKRIEIM